MLERDHRFGDRPPERQILMAAGDMSNCSRASMRVTRQLDRDAKTLACDWWETEAAVMMIDLARASSYGVVLAAIAEAIRRTGDPLWVVGQTTPAAAHSVAWEWLRAGVEPSDVGAWLRAVCWDPRAARALGDAGVLAAGLVDGEGRFRFTVDGPGGEPMPLAQAVADQHITVEQAAQIAQGPPLPTSV
jgi:hypothetical protein